MQVVILAPGTRGDVAPLAGLGHRLSLDGGHRVTVVADGRYSALVGESRCGFRGAPGDLSATLAGAAEGSSRPSPRVMRAHLMALTAYFDQFARHAVTASEGADVLLVNSVAPFGHDIAEGLGVPAVDAFLQPIEPSGAYPPVLLGSVPRLTGTGNLLLGILLRAVPAPADKACAVVRRDLGLPPLSRRAGQRRRRRAGAPVHHGISTAVLPRPRDWRPALSLDGYWWPVVPPSWAPPADLVDFLAAGPPPVIAGFGSTAVPDRILHDVVLPAVRDAGVRLVVQSERPVELNGDDVLRVGDIPHDWLLPRAVTMIHHAGAGTTAAGLRAGVPAVTVPVHTDQAFWASRIAALGAGPAPIPFRRLSRQRLADALRAAVTHQPYRHAAQAIGRRIVAEDGAVAVLERLERLPATS